MVDHKPTVPLGDGAPKRKMPEPGEASLRPLARDRYVEFLPVGEGGMGIVYWALDQDLKRQVAFKVIRPPAMPGRKDVTPPVPQALAVPSSTAGEAADFRAMTARFLQEAWITGALDHPGIVPIYELGKTDAGIPYYTMKFIRDSRTLGTAIDETAGAALETRLALLEPFLKVCDTIRYAHRQGVVHRDLKPANIALGEFGEVLVLDWGLAKLQGTGAEQTSGWQEGVEALRESTGLHTLAGAVGTPGYMAPEAARGEGDTVSELCDVYSLGAILHEVLTHRLPIVFESLGAYFAKLEKADVPNPRSLQADVPETLARICSSALHPDPTQRTASVDLLARSLRTWQARRALERELATLLADADQRLADARDLTGDAALKQLDGAASAVRRALELDADHAAAGERMARVEAARTEALLERERIARARAMRRAGGIGLIVAALAALLVAGLLENARQKAEDARADAASARGRAEADRARAETVMGFMVGEMQESLEPLGRLDLLAGLGREAKAYYDSLPVAERHPDSLRNGTLALRKLGDVYHEQGDLPAARSAYEASVALAEGLPSGGGEDAYLLSEARAKRCGVLIDQGHPGRAVKQLEAHMSDVQARAKQHPASLALRAALAEAHDLLCRAHTGTLDIDKALTSSEAALAIAERLAARDDATGARHRVLVRYLLTPARGLRMRGRLKEGAGRAERALTIALGWRERRPADMRWLRLGSDAAAVRAVFHGHAGDYQIALPLFEQAQTGYERLASLDPANMAVRHRHAELLHSYGKALLQSARAPGIVGAEVTVHHEPWERAYEMQRALVEKDPTNAYWLHSMMGHCERMSVIVKERAGRADSAQRAAAYGDEALGWARRLVECAPDNILWQHLYAYWLFRHAVPRLALQPERARDHLREVIRRCRELAGRHPSGLAELAVLHWWAVGALAQEGGTPPADILTLTRSSIELLDAAHTQEPSSIETQEVRLQAMAALVRALAEGSRAERAEAQVVARRGADAARTSLKRPDRIRESYRRSMAASLAVFAAQLGDDARSLEPPK